MSEKSGATSDKNVEQAHCGNYEGIRQRLVKGENVMPIPRLNVTYNKPRCITHSLGAIFAP